MEGLRFAEGATARQAMVTFPDGRHQRLARGRGLHVPGLRGAAPPTSHLYEQASELLDAGGPGPVVDVGAGAGHGTAILAQRHGDVVAVDADPAVAMLLAHHAPDQRRVIQSLGDEAPPTDALGQDLGAAVIVDTLALAVDPTALLRDLRRRLRGGAPVVVVEPRAAGRQCLLPPQRRAFSPLELEHLLAACGFVAEESAGEAGAFLILRAVASDDDDHDYLTAGDRARAAGDGDDALMAYRAAQASRRPALRREAFLGEALLRQLVHDGDGAVAALIEARKLDEQDARVLAALGQLSLAIGDVDQAVRLGKAALELDPCEVNAAVVVAQTCAVTRPGDALHAWFRALSLAPAEAALVEQVATLSREQGHPRLGLFAVESLLEFGGQPPLPVHLEHARLLLALGRRADAGRVARLAALLAPDDPDLLALQRDL